MCFKVFIDILFNKMVSVGVKLLKILPQILLFEYGLNL